MPRPPAAPAQGPSAATATHLLPRTGWAGWMSRLLPSACAICGRWPSAPLGEPVCGDCLAELHHPLHRCTRCASTDLPAQVDVCADCAARPPLLAHCLAAVDYAYPWSTLMQRFKFAAQPGWADFFARLLLATTATQAAEHLAQTDWLVPVPLSPQRLGERGFNQAWLLASALAREAPRLPAWQPGSPVPVARMDLLCKLGDTASQHALDRGARLRNLRAAFTVPPACEALVRGKRIMLVDDVMTTGATLHAAAAELLRAGASHVGAMVVARTPAA